MRDYFKKRKKVRIIKANYLLQAKIGTGDIDPNIIKQCQKILDDNDIDFSPLAREFLDNLKNTIQKTKTGEISQNDAIDNMTQSIMQLKANAPIFHYKLVGNLAKVMMGFLESLDIIDDDAIEIVEAHYLTLNTIIEKKMRGDGGEYGEKLKRELIGACERYHNSRTIS